MVLELVTNLLTVLLGTASDTAVSNAAMDFVVTNVPVSIPGMNVKEIAPTIRDSATSFMEQNWTSYSFPQDEDSFDYIIVGGGTSGLTLAAKLSDKKGLKILVVEVGRDPTKDCVVPGLYQLLPQSPLDWALKSEKQKDKFEGQNGECLSYTSGKVLGGTSGIDQLMYVRSGEADFKNWQKISKKWSWDITKEHFKNSERMEDETILAVSECGKEVHGTKGRIIVNGQSTNDHFKAKEDIMIQAFKELGSETLKDINCIKRIGISNLQFTIGDNVDGNQVRQSAAQSYYLPIRNRRSVHLLNNALATKIIFDKEKKAQGVRVTRLGKELVFHATKEVIISAGPFNTAKILLLSGVGPRKELKKFGIKEIADLPVGKNFQDKVKIVMAITGQLNPATKLETALSATNLNSFPFPVIGGFMDVKKAKQTDISLRSYFFGAFSPLLFNFLTTVNNYNEKVSLSYIQASLDNEILIPVLLLANPKSKGQVTLRSKNPEDPPIISANLLSNTDDVNTLVKGLKQIYKLKDTKYFKDAGGRFVAPFLPACLKSKVGSDAYWKCYVNNMASAASNPYGTCKMASNGVVDENLKVHKVKNLRIVDNSVIPVGHSGNYADIGMMIAEYAAKMIKDENAKPLTKS